MMEIDIVSNISNVKPVEKIDSKIVIIMGFANGIY
jgi:hypothetical protein